jgi:hypothetical protein
MSLQQQQNIYSFYRGIYSVIAEIPALKNMTLNIYKKSPLEGAFLKSELILRKQGI